MAVAGVAWGVYSLAGRTAPDPIVSNALSFVWSAVLATLLLPAFQASITLSPWGVALALVSGGVTSGLGYAVWYRALPHLSVTQAAVAQLSVPALAALGAAVFLREALTARFVLASAAILGGVGLTLSVGRRRRA
jgi:drug/metabolite transporter (DMT)-like permease